MPNKFHFFTDYDLLITQAAAQAYGPAGNNGTHDEFRVTSLHQTSAQANAYAVCDGIICAQIDASNPNLLNIVLKPMQQPPLNFVPVKYYIYKGIEKSSLISTNGTEIEYTSTLKVVQSIKDSQDAYNASYDRANNNPVGTTQTVASSKALGIQYTSSALAPDTVLDTDSIDLLFYRDNSDYQLPVVRAGWSIGLFNTGTFGFEIILDSIYYEPTLNRVRYFDGSSAKHTIQVPQLPSTPTQAETFEHWHDKETILNFMDPAAYYGSMYGITIEATNSTGTKSKKKGNEIYDNLLNTFYNRNRTYIDIRNEHNHSIDYYNNYGQDIQMAFDYTSSLQTINYYRADWPILIVENNEFPTGNTSNKQVMRLAFPQGASDENPNPMAYLSQGYFEDIFPKQPERMLKFVPLEINSIYTSEISIAVPNKFSISNTVICSLIELKYLKRYHENLNEVSSGVVFRRNNIFDFVYNFNLLKEFNNNYNINFTLNCSEFYIDFLKTNSCSGCYNIGVFEDSESVGILATLKISLEDFHYKTGDEINLSSFRSNVDDTFLDFLTRKKLKEFIKTETFEPVGGGNSFDLYYTNDNYQAISPYESSPSSDEFIYFDISKTDFQNLKNSITGILLLKYPVFINLLSTTITLDKNKREIHEYELEVIGYELINNTLSIKSINSGIKVSYYAHL